MPKYARFDHTAPEPQPVTGWYPADEIHYTVLPPIEDLIEMTQEQWDNRINTPFVRGRCLVQTPAEIVREKSKKEELDLLQQVYIATAQATNIKYMGTEFQADDKSQAAITNTLVGGVLPDGFYWLDANNVKIAMTYQQLQGLASAIVLAKQAIFCKYQVQKEKIV